MPSVIMLCHYVKCYHAGCRLLQLSQICPFASVVILSVFMQSVTMLSVIILSIVILSVIVPNVVALDEQMTRNGHGSTIHPKIAVVFGNSGNI
jgi:hypothetical protein